MLEVMVKLLVAYQVGGFMGGDILRRLLGGDDLRNAGSGNVGATNALRTRGRGFAIGVLAIDVGKGVLVVLLIAPLAWPWPGRSPLPLSVLTYACAAAVVLGHCYPRQHRFQGGKGVATLAGVFGALLPWALPWILLAFIVTILISGYVSLASLLAALAALLWVVLSVPGGVLSAAGLFTIAMLVLLVIKHRENLTRLMAGTESRFERARLIGRRLDRWRGR